MTSGILSGIEISHQIDQGRISIEPYNPKYLNPASYDLTLGKEVAVYDRVTIPDFGGDVPGERLYPRNMGVSNFLDAKLENRVTRFSMDERGFLLKPGIAYLMHTSEKVGTDHYVPIIDGKSSVGRLFIQIHATAGLGDPGFCGQYTLEVIVTVPVLVYPGMRIGQVRFYSINGEVTSYKETGHYKNEYAVGPIPSMLHKSFHGQ